MSLRSLGAEICCIKGVVVRCLYFYFFCYPLKTSVEGKKTIVVAYIVSYSDLKLVESLFCSSRKLRKPVV